MATLLVTSRMHPALAARVDASVRGRRRKAQSPRAKRLVARVAVLAFVAAILGVVALALHARAEERRAIESSRRALLEAIHARASSLAPGDERAVERADEQLERAAGAYEGDVVADELRAPGGIAGALARATLYVRGPLDAFHAAATIADLAAAAPKDAFLFCLADPPASRAEKTLLAKVHVAYGGGARAEKITPSVSRLGDAVVGLPFLGAAWIDRVRTAPDLDAIAALRASFDRAPLDRATRAAGAHQLLFVMDEPGEPGSVAELDGERAHAVRIELVDLVSSRVLLRLRRSIDPSWITPEMRTRYAAGLDGCALAYDVIGALGAR